MNSSSFITVGGKNYTFKEIFGMGAGDGSFPRKQFWTLWREHKTEMKALGFFPYRAYVSGFGERWLVKIER